MNGYPYTLNDLLICQGGVHHRLKTAHEVCVANAAVEADRAATNAALDALTEDGDWLEYSRGRFVRCWDQELEAGIRGGEAVLPGDSPLEALHAASREGTE